MQQERTPQKGREREGIVVWDQQGIVIIWPDGHHSRFYWEMLRQGCRCAECRVQHVGHETVPQYLTP